MAGVDLACCLLLGLLGIAVLVDTATVALLYAVFFALGTAETLFDNAAVSILPAVVPAGVLPRANGRLLGVRMVSEQLAGPPLGGCCSPPRPRCRSCWTLGRSRPPRS